MSTRILPASCSRYAPTTSADLVIQGAHNDGVTDRTAELGAGGHGATLRLPRQGFGELLCLAGLTIEYRRVACV